MNVKVVSLFLVTSEVVEHFIRIFAKEAFLTSEPAVLDEDSWRILTKKNATRISPIGGILERIAIGQNSRMLQIGNILQD